MNKSVTMICSALIALVLSSPVGASTTPSDVMLVLDNSGSMRKNDPGFLAKQAVRDFIGGLDATARAGVIIFDQKVDLAVPLVPLDAASRERLRGSLDKINYRGQYTDSPAAVERAIYELKTRGRQDVSKVILFMTDGIVDTGNAAADVEKTKWLREDLAQDAAEHGIKVFAIAFTENADFFLIQSLANKTRGEYFRAIAAEDLAAVFDKVRVKLAGPVPEPVAVAPPAPPAPPPEPVTTPIPEAPPPLPPAAVAPPPAAVAPPPAPAPPAVPPAPAAPPAVPPGPAAVPPQAGPEEEPMALEELSAEEREALEELARETGVPVEQLFAEIMSAPEGEVVVVRPEDGAMPPAEPRALIILGLAALLLIALGLGLWSVVRRWRRRSRPAETAVAPPPPPPAVPEAFLNDPHGYTDEPAIRLGEKPIMLGRVAGGDTEHLDYYVISKPTVGRRHAVIKYRDHSFWIVDQGSVNGTFVNDDRVSGERQLKHGDRIKLHKYEFEFTMPGMEAAGATIIADPHDATMVADMEATMAATAATALRAGGAEAAAEPAVAPDAGDDLFEAGPEDAGAAAPGQAEDLFATDVGGLAPESEDWEAHAEEFGAAPPEGAAPEDEDLGVEINLDAIGAEGASGLLHEVSADEEAADFNAEASAFFDDITVGPVSDDGGGPVPVVDDGGFDEEEPPPEAQAATEHTFDRAAASPDALDSTAAGDAPDDLFSEAETMAMDEPAAPDAPDDVSLDEFIDTASFDAARTVPPAAPEEGDVSLEDFMSTSLLDTGSEDRTVLPDEIPDLSASDDVFDVTGAHPYPGTTEPEVSDEDATLLPSDVPDKRRPSGDDEDDEDDATFFDMDDEPQK